MRRMILVVLAALSVTGCGFNYDRAVAHKYEIGSNQALLVGRWEYIGGNMKAPEEKYMLFTGSEILINHSKDRFRYSRGYEAFDDEFVTLFTNMKHYSGPVYIKGKKCDVHKFDYAIKRDGRTLYLTIRGKKNALGQISTKRDGTYVRRMRPLEAIRLDRFETKQRIEAKQKKEQ